MAVAPLFLSDKDELQRRVGVSNISFEGFDDVLDQVILDARAFMRSKLGQTKIDAILTTPTSDAPSTDAEYERFHANSLEAAQVKLFLVPKLSVIFKDEKSTAIDVINDLDLGTDINDPETKMMVEEDLVCERDRHLNAILGEDTSCAPRLFVSVPESDNAPRKPYHSIDAGTQTVEDLEIGLGS